MPWNVGLPGEGATGTVLAGNVVHLEAVPDASIVTRPTADGAQAILVIDGDDAPERYSFPVEIGGVPASLRLGEGGAIEIKFSYSGDLDGWKRYRC